MKEKIIEVIAAIIEKEGKILIARRKREKLFGGLWEFPGGKLEEGETHEECIIRELQEEMEIAVMPREFLSQNIHVFEKGKIQLSGYMATHVSGDIVLNEHDVYKWVEVSELDGYQFAEADIPFIEEIKKVIK